MRAPVLVLLAVIAVVVGWLLLADAEEPAPAVDATPSPNHTRPLPGPAGIAQVPQLPPQPSGPRDVMQSRIAISSCSSTD